MRVYLFLAAVAAFFGVVGIAAWYRSEAIQAEAALEFATRELDVARKVNDANIVALNEIKAARERDEQLLSELMEAQRAINESTADLNKAVSDLELANETVRSYLSSPIPDDLKRLLNR